MDPLKIFLLGDFRIEWNGVPLGQFPTRKARSLFVYLLPHRHRVNTRAHIAGILWGEFSEDRALRNLSTTLWRIRQLIPDDDLVIEGDTIAFNIDCNFWFDASYSLIACFQSQASHTLALETGQKLLYVDPLREDVHQIMMGIYALLGQRQAGMAQFQ